MFNKKTIILLILFSHTMIAWAALFPKFKSTDAPQVSKAPALTPQQVEYSKKFFKKLVDGKDKEDPKKTTNYASDETGSDKPLKQGAPMQVTNYKTVPSGGTVFADGLFHNFFPVGDPYGGLPDGLISMGKYCVEFIVKGILILIYMTVRYPHKLLLKVLVATSALTWLPMNMLYCLSPISMANFISKAKIINRKHDALAKIQYELKVRWANIYDKVHESTEVTKLTCCSFAEFKRKSVEAAPEEGKEFLASYFAGFFKLNQLVYCGEYQDNSPQCAEVQYIDDDPVQVIPRSFITLIMQILVKYF